MLASRGYEDIMNFVSMPSGHADMYSKSAAKVLKRAAQLIVKEIEPFKGVIGGEGEVILDIGCGTGETTKLLLDTVPNVEKIIGIDIDEDFLEKAEQTVNDPRCSFENLDAELDWPEEWEGKFTKIFSNYCFHWIRDHEMLLKQMMRVLKPGGEIISQFFHSTTHQDELHASKKAAIETGVAPLIQESLKRRAEQSWKNADNYANLAMSAGLTTLTCRVVPRALKVKSKLERAGMALSVSPIVDVLPLESRSRFALKYTENLKDPLTINHNVLLVRLQKSPKLC